MTIQQALREITSKKKWYVQHDERGNRDESAETKLRVVALRILKGTAKPATIERFFNQMGYQLETNIKVKKI